MNSIRPTALLTCLMVVGCYGAETAERYADAETEVDADIVALEGLADYYETHYNMHHADMVAETFAAEESGGLWADGSVTEGRAEIQANLEANMAGSPVLDLVPQEHMVFGDIAVGHGTYEVEATPPDMETQNMSGHWLAFYNRQEDDSWKIGWVTSNYDHDWPEGAMRGPVPEEGPEDSGTMTDLIGGWATHYNLGHPGMVADLHTEDGFAAFSGRPALQGRAAIEADLTARMAELAVDVELHDVETIDLGDGWAIDGGWYQLNAKEGGDMLQTGSYMALAKQAEDGSWQLHWLVSNGHPAEAIEGQ